jgi:Ca2+-binding EF-hand superfamily protein
MHISARRASATSALAILLLWSAIAAEPQEKATAPTPPSQGEGTAVKPAEIAEMFWVIVNGGQMSGNGGWFHPGQSRYGWKWLFEHFDNNNDEKITKDEFRGPVELFQRLDRNKDGNITQDDLDWSSNSAFARASMPSSQWFRMFDTNSNGKISREEWEALFNRASKGKGFLTAEDLREAFPTTPPPRPTGAAAQAAGMPSKQVLLKGLLSGELGSAHQGPAIGDNAPDFTLRTQDGKRQIHLADFRGKKPVVLVFGSFT